MKWPNAEVDWDPHRWLRRRRAEQVPRKPTGADFMESFYEWFKASIKRRETDV